MEMMAGFRTLNVNSDQMMHTLTTEKTMASILYKLGEILRVHHHSACNNKLDHFVSALFGRNVEVNLLLRQVI